VLPLRKLPRGHGSAGRENAFPPPWAAGNVLCLEFRASQRSGCKTPCGKKLIGNHINSNPGLVAGDWPRLCCFHALLLLRAVGSCPGEPGLVVEVRKESRCLLAMKDADTGSGNPDVQRFLQCRQSLGMHVPGQPSPSKAQSPNCPTANIVWRVKHRQLGGKQGLCTGLADF